MSEMYDNNQRTSFFKKDDSLEEVLLDLNSLIEEVKIRNYKHETKSPIILIMGCARSGSTLMMQWLASLQLFSYPSNLIARFYKNPYIGIRVQQALLEYDPMNQLGFKDLENPFMSTLGKTMGALSPSEYWYFWREHFNFNEDSSVLNEKQLKEVDGTSFLSKLSTFEYLTGKPLALKGMILNYHIPFLYKLYPKFLFINLTRDSFSNAQSLLLAREKYFSDRNKWYSFKPPEYEVLKDLDPISQVAGQVIYTKCAIVRALTKIPEDNVLTVSYSDFCTNPNGFLEKLLEKYNRLGGSCISDIDATRTWDFISSIDVKISSNEAVSLKDQIAHFESITKL
jgi:Sulfotransferase family